MHDNLKTTIANELMLAKMKIHRLEVENRMLRERQLTRLVALATGLFYGIIFGLAIGYWLS